MRMGPNIWTGCFTVGDWNKFQLFQTMLAEKMAAALEISLDELVHGPQNEKARVQITDNELLQLFSITQELADDQKKTVADLLSAFLLKANLTKQLV